jgi:hypothetical protein
MAAIATLIGGTIGFMSFWVAWLGLDYSFWSSLGIYLSAGTMTTLLLIARAVMQDARRGEDSTENSGQKACSTTRSRTAQSAAVWNGASRRASRSSANTIA